MAETLKTIYKRRYQELVDAIISARKAACLTQFQVAEKLKKPQSYVAKIEGKDRKIDVLEFIELCSVLEIKASTIICKIEVLNDD